MLDCLVVCALVATVFAAMRKKDNRLFCSVILAKLVCIFFFSALIDAPFVKSILVRLNTDQLWYHDTAYAVSDAVARGGLFIDYPSVVGNQNFLYNVILGLYARANGSLSDISYLLLNLIIYIDIVFYCVRLRREITGKSGSRIFALLLFLLPTMNIYSFLMLRDLLIALVLCAFLYYLVLRRYIPLAVSLVLIYYLRNQFAYILILAAAVWIYCSVRRQIPLAVRISSAGIILTAGI
ncbi:MAG: hypothetical protein ACRCUT_08455, partial [Spirochaetota bacterium]